MKVKQHLSELLAAILPHVVFDGWSQTSFDCAVADLDMDPAFAAMLAPRGALDLAVAYHSQGRCGDVRRLPVLIHCLPEN